MKYFTCLIFVSFFIALLPSTFVNAQESLSLNEAIQQGLENNFGIQIYRNLFDISENNQSLGNAGFLPTISATASSTERIEDSEFQAGGEARSTSGARSSSKNAALNFDWTVFDGLRMFSSYQRLGTLRNLRDRELQLAAETLIAEITVAYFNIIRINEQLKILDNNIAVSRERIEIEETKVDLGSGSEYDLLQARSDLNADIAARLRESNSLTEAKINLNRLISLSPDNDYCVSSDINVNRALSRENLKQKVLNDNIELAIARTNREVSKLELNEIQRERYPEVSISGGYNFNRSENSGGFISFNETTGFSFGISARINMFDGFNMSRRIQNARISEKNAELSYRDQLLQIESDFLTLFRAYQNSLELVDLEEDSFRNAEEVLDIALERFRLGSISSLEFREAQRTFLQAENRLINAKFESKIAETELLRLSGDLGAIRVR